MGIAVGRASESHQTYACDDFICSIIFNITTTFPIPQFFISPSNKKNTKNPSNMDGGQLDINIKQ